ncbi:MAG: hypothetical protein ACN4GW_06615 [Desulforhopalus sp.]
MVNPFTIQTKISTIQQDVLRPLYTLEQGSEEKSHSWLLVETGRAIGRHQRYIEELCASRLVSAAFKVVKLLGGAEQLTEDDYRRFTSYVNDGGIKAMVKMLLSVDKEKTFLEELEMLPLGVRQNASQMLHKSSALHNDFINGYLQDNFGSLSSSPPKIIDNFNKSQQFINTLANLAASKMDER